MDKLNGKRLLLLGGVRPAIEIVKEAHKMGVEVYVTDYLENSPAKKFADKSFMVNAMNVDDVVKLCRDEKIDGIITGYVDSLLPYCEKICKELNLPFWGNEDNIEMCISKDKFKQACEVAGVPVVPYVKCTEEDYKSYVDTLAMPVVIKPVDNSGSRGVFKCYKKEDYDMLCEKALSFSKCKEILVEKMMDAHAEFSAYYMLSDGEVYLTGMGDRFVNVMENDIAPIGQGMILPSKHLETWENKVDDKVKNLFKLNDMQNGFVFVQGFHEDGEFYIHEIGYRLNGGFSYKLVENISKYNQVQQLIRFALTGEMDKPELEKSNPYFDKIGFILTISLKAGKITSVDGIEEISELPGVVEFCKLHDEGEELLSRGTTAQNFAYILCSVYNKEELNAIIETVNKKLRVNDEDGENMILPVIEADRIWKDR